MTTNSGPTIIEIIDSSEDSDNDEVPNKRQRRSVSTKTSTPVIIETTSQVQELAENSGSSKEAPKKVHNRRKSVHHAIRALEDLSFESVITPSSKADNSVTDASAKDAKKRWGESNIDATTEDNSEDPEMTRLLKKIAYCRVFTNYLLRQYDMLAIDFKLYSNIDLLMLELKKRVDTYTAIRRSRQRLLLNREIIGNL